MPTHPSPASHLQTVLPPLPPQQQQLLLGGLQPAPSLLQLLTQTSNLGLQVLPATLEHLILGKSPSELRVEGEAAPRQPPGQPSPLNRPPTPTGTHLPLQTLQPRPQLCPSQGLSLALPLKAVQFPLKLLLSL